MTTKTDNLMPLVAAIRRLLANPTPDCRPSWYSDGRSIWEPGYFLGYVRGLFRSLTECDEEYCAVVDRPHEAKELRALLRRNAQTLHAEHGLIVNLNGQAVSIEPVSLTTNN
jgi:hypothetical protein